MNEAIEKMMKILGCSEDEARQLVADDAAIDKGEKLFELSDEQKKASKKARSTGTKKRPTAYKFEKRERKPNEVKRWIIDRLRILCEGWELNGDALDVKVTNIERTIDFNIDGRAFTLTLTEHRPPKDKAGA